MTFSELPVGQTFKVGLPSKPIPPKNAPVWRKVSDQRAESLRHGTPGVFAPNREVFPQ